jgi:hypothetical protein
MVFNLPKDAAWVASHAAPVLEISGEKLTSVRISG